MRTLNTIESQFVHGGGNFLKIISGGIWGAIGGAILTIPLGPAAMIAGAGVGMYNGIAMMTIKEGAERLTDLNMQFNQEYNNPPSILGY